MAIVIEGYTVVIRNATLDEKYPGGRAAFQREVPNRTYCHDDSLSRVGFMHPADVLSFLTALEQKGLQPFEGEVARDVVIVSEAEGPSQSCDWLEIGRYQAAAIAWATGEKPAEVVGPPGWSPGQLGWLSAGDASERLT